jgi:O-antigen ligase
MLAVAVLKLRRNEVRTIAVMLVISVGLAVALFFQNSLPAFLRSLVPEDMATLNSRTELWAKTLSYIWAQPLLGCGYFASRYLLVKDFHWAGHAHNSFLEVLLTTGLIGLLILVAFLVLVFKEICGTRNGFLLGATLYCLIQGTLNPLFFNPGIAMFVLTIAVLNARTHGPSIPMPLREGTCPPRAPFGKGTCAPTGRTSPLSKRSRTDTAV